MPMAYGGSTSCHPLEQDAQPGVCLRQVSHNSNVNACPHDLPPNTLLPVAKKMEEDGELQRSTDYSTQPPGHIYSLTPKGKAKP